MEKELKFKDEMRMQAHPIDPGGKGGEAKAYVLIVQILEVYRGTRWRDTAISEIVVE